MGIRDWVKPSSITVRNGEYKALVENLEYLKQAIAELSVGHKLTVDILGSIVARQESMASILDGLQCRLSSPQPCAPSPPKQQQEED